MSLYPTRETAFAVFSCGSSNVNVLGMEIKMKKKLWITLLLSAVCCCLLSGCSMKTSYIYDDFDKYTKGGATLDTTIKNIDIGWISGTVKIRTHQENTISFNETSNKKVNENSSMYYYVEGDTLHIKFSKSGKFNFSNLNKTLTIEVPDTIILDTVSLDIVSAQANISDLYIRTLDVNTVSGDVALTSSDLEAFDINTVSGSITLNTFICPQEGSFQSVSGSVSLSLPEDADYEMDFDTVSGNYNSAFSTKVNNGKYTVGEGKAKYDAETVSGNVNIRLNSSSSSLEFF